MYSINVLKNKSVIDELSKDQLEYLTTINSILSNPKEYEIMLQAQSLDMYESYYKSYMERIILKNQKGWFKTYSEKQAEENRELLLLNLIRNKSHSEFIERALKLKYSEETDIIGDKNILKYRTLKKYIEKHFR